MFKAIRVFILLLIFFAVMLGAWRAKTRSVEWKYALPVNVYLVNGDNSQASAEYIKGLTLADFKPIETFMKDEAARYGREAQASIEIKLKGTLDKLPPPPPNNSSSIEVILWSLNMRWWSYRNAETKGAEPQVKLFLLYFDSVKTPRLGHSTGLQKGLIGRVNVFANPKMSQQNNVVITHEFLHTLGATDKYNFETNLPIFPQGYAIPDQVPLLPQRYAEIMAGRTPITQSESEIPDSLSDAVIGRETAIEINWL